jgi:hypothetical protein
VKRAESAYLLISNRRDIEGSVSAAIEHCQCIKLAVGFVGEIPAGYLNRNSTLMGQFQQKNPANIKLVTNRL